MIFRAVSKLEALGLQKVKHACHVMLHAPVSQDGVGGLPEDVHLFKRYRIQDTILMQMRFDGKIGFPGGFVDDFDKTWENALVRELEEELGKLPENFEITENSYVASHFCQEKNMCLHFYSKKLKFSDLLELEKRKENPCCAGFEVLGSIRVPLFRLADGYGGLPSFLRNNFVGCAKEQLIIGIRKAKLLPDEELNECMKISEELKTFVEIR